MKFRAPPHCRAVSHGGTTLAVAPDHSIEAPEADAAQLSTHGIKPWASAMGHAPPPRQRCTQDLEAMPRSAIVAALARLGRAASPSTRTAELRRVLRHALAGRG